MFAVIASAKTMDFSPLDCPVETSIPHFLDEAEKLVRTARRLSQKEIVELMKVSAVLAKQTAESFRSFETPFDNHNAKPAVLAFSGDVYRGIDAVSLDPGDLIWAQNHLAIVSGLFGLLRPLDLIQPYRLEMAYRLKTRRGSNLYDFWSDNLVNHINELVATHENPAIVNLASAEYLRALRPKKVRSQVVTPVFHEIRPGGEGRVISAFAKRARGLMARFIVERRIDNPEGLKDFHVEGYRYQPKKSSQNTLLFSRELK